MNNGLADLLIDYAALAAGLENKRVELQKRICEVVRAELIPCVAQKVSSPYSIDSEFVDVKGVQEPGPLHTLLEKRVVPTLAKNQAPLGFAVSIKMLYCGKPIYHGSVQTIGLYALQKEVAPILDAFAEKYNLVKVSCDGEPAPRNS